MRVRTAKQRAERIDLNYFKRRHGLARWRLLLSVALPLAALAWVTATAASGNRAPYSAGPLSTAHAFAEQRCEVCHTGALDPRSPPDPRNPRNPRSPRHPRDPRIPRPATAGFRAHTTDAACLTCHDAPAHAVNQTPPPSCAACHQDHRGRVAIAKVDDGFCVQCHGELKTTHGPPTVAIAVEGFPAQHPEFAAVNTGARDAARLRFNHAVHLKDSLRGPNGPETLACTTCHEPETGRAGVRAKGPATTGLMTPVRYEQDCARCHPLFFDERIADAAPHASTIKVRAFVQQALAAYIREHPGDITKPDEAVRRVPLNFPRPPEPPARNAEEWVTRRAAADERLLWNKTCAECHEPASATASSGQASIAARPAGLPDYAATNVPKRWMPRAAFDHTPHRMVTCQSCHAAVGSTQTSDVLLPGRAVCATCHASSPRRADARCVECHQYHDWAKSHPVTPPYSLTDFK